MNGSCSQESCPISDGLPCDVGHPHVLDCPHFHINTEEQNAKARSGFTPDEAFGQRLPWTGRALGVADLALASARTSPAIVGVVGPFHAGKTGLLTALFAHLAKSGRIGPFGFAGSFTLQGWQRLRGYTLWPAPGGLSFPPHTPDSGDRVPSLLHLALRRDGERIRDLLFTDAPGEWFTRWIKNQTSEEAKGARWIADMATHLLFVVDRAAFAGSDVGRARQETLALARLVAENRKMRPLVVAWTKSDLDCDTTIEAPIREKLADFFGVHPSFNLSVKDSRCLEMAAHFLEDSPKEPLLRAPRAAPASAFFAYGRSAQ